MYHALQGLDILFTIGLTCNPRTLALKMKDLGKNHDMELIQWKSRLELGNEVKRAHYMVREELLSLSYLPELPSKDDFRCYAKQLKKVKPWYHVLQIVHSYLPLMLIA